MTMIGRLAIQTAFLVPLIAGPVDAQNYPADLGVYGGFSWYSKMLSGDDLADEFAGANFKLGPFIGAEAGYWFTPRIGARANLAYADRPLEVQVQSGPDHETIRHVNLWSLSGDMLIRLREPNSQWTGTEFLPYVAFGAGARWIDPAGRGSTCFEGNDPDDDFECHPFGTEAGGDLPHETYALEKGPRLMGLVGLGTDVRFAPNLAIRLELTDRIYRPDVFRITTSHPPYRVAEEAEQEHSGIRTVHEIGARIGLHLLFGAARRQVAIAAQPLPEREAPLREQEASRREQEAARREREAARADTQPVRRTLAASEEAISVCVIDLESTTGIRTQRAIFLPDRGDTVVIVNGQRTPLRNSVGHVMVASDADWYIRGQPLVMNVGSDRVEYLTYGGARRMEADRLAYLGTIDGYPVYADREEVADIIVPLQTLRERRPGADLGTLLASRRDLRDRVQDIRFVYVPLAPTGCVFQTVQAVEQVRKGRQ